jgi:hypothetical protein
VYDTLFKITVNGKAVTAEAPSSIAVEAVLIKVLGKGPASRETPVWNEVE